MTEAESIMRLARIITAVSELYWLDPEDKQYQEWASINVDDIDPRDMSAPHGPLAYAIRDMLTLWRQSKPIDENTDNVVDLADEVSRDMAPETKSSKVCDFCMNNLASVHLYEQEIWLCEGCDFLHGDMFKEEPRDPTEPEFAGLGAYPKDGEDAPGYTEAPVPKKDEDPPGGLQEAEEVGEVEETEVVEVTSRIRSWGKLPKERNTPAHPIEVD